MKMAWVREHWTPEESRRAREWMLEAVRTGHHMHYRLLPKRTRY